MKYRGINLSRHPFVNARPVVRLATFLWSVGGLLLLLNVFLYWKSLSGFEDTRRQLDGVEKEIRLEQSAIVVLEERLRGSRLGQQNEEALFLNQKIEQRTFGWGRLFDRLAEVLPIGVRLFDLSPMTARSEGARRLAEDDGRVLLKILGAAETTEDLLNLLDALFAADMFEEPTLTQETREANLLRFRLNVYYLPHLVETPATTEEDPGEEILASASGATPGMEPDVGAVTHESSTVAVAEEGDVPVAAATTSGASRERTGVGATTRAASQRSPGVTSEPRENTTSSLLERSRSRRLEAARQADEDRGEAAARSGAGSLEPVPLGSTASSARRF